MYAPTMEETKTTELTRAVQSLGEIGLNPKISRSIFPESRLVALADNSFV